MACIPCKQKKRRCDDTRPKCLRCSSQDDCSYAPDKRVDRRGRYAVTVGPTPVNVNSGRSVLSAGFEVSVDNFRALAGPESTDWERAKLTPAPPPDVLIGAVFAARLPPLAADRVAVDEIFAQVQRGAELLPNDELFYSAVLAVGALKLARPYQGIIAGVFTLTGPHRGAPLAAAAAYRHYKAACALVPQAVARPTFNGFRGLALVANHMVLVVAMETQVGFCREALRAGVVLGIDAFDPMEQSLRALAACFCSVWQSSCLLLAFYGRSPPLCRHEFRAPAGLVGEFGGGPATPPGEIMDLFSAAKTDAAHASCVVVAGVTWPAGDFSNVCSAESTARSLFQNEAAAVRLNMEISTSQLSQNKINLLVAEIKAWHAHSTILFHLRGLVGRTGARSVDASNAILADLKLTFGDASSINIDLLSLDWDFASSIRTSTIAAFVACAVLTYYANSVVRIPCWKLPGFSSGYQTFKMLVKMVPVNQPLVELLDKAINGDYTGPASRPLVLRLLAGETSLQFDLF